MKAGRRSRGADELAVSVEGVGEGSMAFFAEIRADDVFDIFRIFFFAEPQPESHAHHMGIHDDAGRTEAGRRYEVGRFSAHARQAKQLSHLCGYFPAELGDQDARREHEMSRLCPEKTHRMNEGFYLLRFGGGKREGVGISAEERRRHGVHLVVCTLSAQYDGAKKFETGRILEKGFRVGPERNQDFPDLGNAISQGDVFGWSLFCHGRSIPWPAFRSKVRKRQNLTKARTMI